MSALSSLYGGMAEGVNSGIGLANALQMQPLQRQMLQQKIAQDQQQMAAQQFQNQRAQTMTPVTLNGQVFNIPVDEAAKMEAEIASRKMMMQGLLGKTAMQQDFKTGEPTGQEQTRLDSTKSAVPVHNAAMALYQAYQDANNGDPGTAMTLLKQKLASSPLTSGFVQQVGNDPANIPAIYNAVVTQGAMEQPKLATGSMVVPQGADLELLKNSLYPSLADKPDVAYGKFKNFTDAYIEPAFQAGIAKMQQGMDAQGNFSNPYLARQYSAITDQHTAAMKSLLNMPGYAAGSTVPEASQATQEMSGGGIQNSSQAAANPGLTALGVGISTPTQSNQSAVQTQPLTQAAPASSGIGGILGTQGPKKSYRVLDVTPAPAN